MKMAFCRSSVLLLETKVSGVTRNGFRTVLFMRASGTRTVWIERGLKSFQKSHEMDKLVTDCEMDTSLLVDYRN